MNLNRVKWLVNNRKTEIKLNKNNFKSNKKTAYEKIKSQKSKTI